MVPSHPSAFSSLAAGVEPLHADRARGPLPGRALEEPQAQLPPHERGDHVAPRTLR